MADTIMSNMSDCIINMQFIRVYKYNLKTKKIKSEWIK